MIKSDPCGGLSPRETGDLKRATATGRAEHGQGSVKTARMPDWATQFWLMQIVQIVVVGCIIGAAGVMVLWAVVAVRGIANRVLEAARSFRRVKP